MSFHIKGGECGDAWEPRDNAKGVSVLENLNLAPLFGVIQAVRRDVVRG